MPAWEKVSRKRGAEFPNTTFIRFWIGETDSGKLRCQIDEGYGVQEDDSERPCVFVRHTCRYFNTQIGLEKHISNKREYWQVKSGDFA